MLISFSVTNFRSFKETQTLVMEAAPSTKVLNENIHVFSLPGKKRKPSPLLKSAAIYGPNASINVLFPDELGP